MSVLEVEEKKRFLQSIRIDQEGQMCLMVGVLAGIVIIVVVVKWNDGGGGGIYEEVVVKGNMSVLEVEEKKRFLQSIRIDQEGQMCLMVGVLAGIVIIVVVVKWNDGGGGGIYEEVVVKGYMVEEHALEAILTKKEV
nr:hypothetical protein [Tanacetum cinerariifolium]